MEGHLSPTNDVVFTLLFGSPETKDCLIALLTAVLKPASPITKVEVIDPGIIKENIDDKGIVLDLLMTLEDGSSVDLEMQVRRRQRFRKRALYYLARSYTSQLLRGQDYTRLRPATLIAFLCYEETRASQLHSIYEFREASNQSTFSDDLSLHLIELTKLDKMTPKEQAAEQRLMRWTNFFMAKTDHDRKSSAKGDVIMEKALDYLERLSAKADVRLMAERREMAQLMYQMELTMAKDEAMAEGKLEGEREGEARGKLEGKRDSLFRLLERRGIALSEDQRNVIASCDDMTILDQWFERAITADSAEALGL